MLVHVRDAKNIETHVLEFPGALVLTLDPPLSLHDREQWELAPDARDGIAKVHDLGRHLMAGGGLTVKAGGTIVFELVLRRDEQGWHLTASGAGGLRDVALPDFDPTDSTGLGISARTLH